MRDLFFGLVIAAAALQSGVALAQTADDRRWIRQCVNDNKDQGQSDQVILAYCTCMNNKMSDNETRSITAWEKSNPRAMEACSREAGWSGR